LADDALLYHIKCVGKCYRSNLNQFNRQLAIPTCLRDEILKSYHDDNGHPKFAKQYLGMLQTVYWPDMAKQVAVYIAKCQQCNVACRSPPSKLALEHPPIGVPFQHITVDFLSLPPVTDELTNLTVSHLLIVTDRCSQYTQAYACQGTSAQQAAISLNRYWFSAFGICESLQSDAGPCFTSDLFKALMNQHSIVHHIGASQHHQSQARAENAGKFIVSALVKTLSSQNNWLKALPNILLSLNNTPISTIGLSAFQIIFAQTGRTPANMALPYRESIESDQLSLQSRAQLAQDAVVVTSRNTQQSFAQADKYF
jgi:hypothetical protein